MSKVLLEENQVDEIMDLTMKEVEDILFIANLQNYNGSIKFSKKPHNISVKLEDRYGQFRSILSFCKDQDEKWHTDFFVEYTEKYKDHMSDFYGDNKEDFWEDHHINNGRTKIGFRTKSSNTAILILKKLKKIF